MSRPPESTGELRKLAHALDVPTERLHMIASLPGEDLRTLRMQVSDALFRADKHYFVRVAALSKAVPGAVAAKLTEAVLPPLIAARTAELLEPHRAAELVGRISEKYLAEVALRMDATRAPQVIEAIPPERVGAVAAELARREEWVVIGGFVAQVTSPALAASVARFSGEQLLRIGLVLDDVSRMDEIGEMLTAAQIDEMLAAAAKLELWAELTEVASHLQPQRLRRLAERYADADAATRSAFEAAKERGDLDPDVLRRLSTT
jgi:hypothetical protein